jgi:hypothetical protein
MVVEIGRYLSSEHMLHDPTNHCVPILDYFRDPTDPTIKYIVMPILRPSNDPAFRVIGEVVNFVSQVLEVGHGIHDIPCDMYLEGCQVRQSTLRGSTRETGLSYLRCTEVGT